MIKEYYFVSEGIVKQFPYLEKSKPFQRWFGETYYVVAIPDFDKVDQFIENAKTDEKLFAWGIIDSQVDLTYDCIDYDDQDEEIQVIKTLNIDVCKEWGLLEAIEQELGLTKEQNVAYVLYKLAEHNNVTPIELIELV